MFAARRSAATLSRGRLPSGSMASSMRLESRPRSSALSTLACSSRNSSAQVRCSAVAIEGRPRTTLAIAPACSKFTAPSASAVAVAEQSWPRVAARRVSRPASRGESRRAPETNARSEGAPVVAGTPRVSSSRIIRTPSPWALEVTACRRRVSSTPSASDSCQAASWTRLARSACAASKAASESSSSAPTPVSQHPPLTVFSSTASPRNPYDIVVLTRTHGGNGLVEMSSPMQGRGVPARAHHGTTAESSRPAPTTARRRAARGRLISMGRRSSGTPGAP